MDLAKAFDTVDHVILLSKLKFYGFRGTSYILLCDCLSNQQKEFCFVESYLIWAPSLLACLKDLPCSLHSTSYPHIVIQYSVFDLYADDTEMHCSHSDLGVVEKCLQSDLDDVAH